ncbi:ParB N-terminal domain-containing protein [Hoeflea alexandrii]|uniref:ParB N-terminal domain-containing protein n=2 Tax=Hoeflea alexandrii TaxID=288436 RepID=A0ABT1CMB4_9HYPH|nr:DUF6551 family protein [Hoeflea alexandrii]MCO6407337.1 ParB N-terminal domain-containing protein [Hoeflea alexandrii]
MRKIEVSKYLKTEGEPGPAPMLQWIEISLLVVDDSYQRELKAGNWKAIHRIATGFRWSRFSPVFVAPVEGGRYAIIDGQHRVHGAMMAGIESVPCQVVHMTREEQAAAFAAVNGDVTKVTAWQVFKAALAAGEKWAVEAANVASEAGCELMVQNASSWTKKPKQIYAVTGFRKLLTAHKRENVVAALTAIAQAEGFSDVPDMWDGSIILPVLSACSQRPRAVTRGEAFIDFLEMWPLLDEMERIQSQTKERIRKGLPYIGKKEQLESALIDAIDRKFVDRMMLPAPEAVK